MILLLMRLMVENGRGLRAHPDLLILYILYVNYSTYLGSAGLPILLQNLRLLSVHRGDVTL